MIKHISELSKLMNIIEADIIKAFMETNPDLLCNEQYIAEKHFDILREAYNRHLERVAPTIEPISISDFNYTGSGVYFLFDEYETIIYIGQSVNIQKRCIEHTKDKYFCSIGYLPISSEFELLMTEDANIKHYKPSLNKVEPFTPYSLLKTFIQMNEFEGIKMDKLPKIRRSYKQIRQQKKKRTGTKPRKSMIKKSYWKSIGK